MKTSIFLLVMVVLVSTNLNADLLDGLVAYYPFNGNANDASGGGYDGSVVGATLTSDKFGNSNSSYYFDGSGDYIDIGDQTDLEGFGAVTISAWINCGLMGGDSYNIAGKAGVYKIDYYNSKIRFLTGNDFAGSILTTKSTLSNNEWHHIVATYDGSIKRVYIDNIMDPTTVLTSGSLGANTKEVSIGAHRQFETWDHFFKGAIDEVRIYDRALSQSEVTQLYNAPETTTMTISFDIKPASCPNPLNTKSKGVLPVAILGTDAFDVSDIDLASIRLEGVAPVRSGIEDVAAPNTDTDECACTAFGPDGYDDLTLKFKTQAIVEALGDLDHGDMWQLYLEGVLKDGTPIEGSDCVIIRGKARSLHGADVNNDGVVNVIDFSIFADNWLQSSTD